VRATKFHPTGYAWTCALIVSAETEDIAVSRQDAARYRGITASGVHRRNQFSSHLLRNSIAVISTLHCQNGYTLALTDFYL
jgi:hypothetical protein